MARGLLTTGAHRHAASRVGAARIALLAAIGLAAAASVGCAPGPLRTMAGDWPREIEGRTLYYTAQGLICASNPCAGAWADRYLRKRLPRLERELGLVLGRGVVIVIEPGDPPMCGVNQWPAYEATTRPAVFTDLPRGPPTALGLPPTLNAAFPWACVLPTDRFYRAAFEHAVRQEDRGRADHAVIYALTQWPILLLRPEARRVYLLECDLDREWALAQVAIEHAGLGKEDADRVLARASALWSQRRAAVQRGALLPK
jgi:hypothetical protein